MKILLVSEDIPATKLGGLGKHVVSLGNALIAAGHEVALMGRDAPNYSDCADEIGFNGQFIAGFGNPLKGWKEQQLGFFNPWKRPYFAKQLATAMLAHANEFDVIHYHGHQPMVGRYIPTNVNFIQTRHDQGGDCITNMRFLNGDVCRERSPSACAQCIYPKPGRFRTAMSAIAVERYRNNTEAAYAKHPVIFVSEFLRTNYVATMPSARLSKSWVIHNYLNEQLLEATASQLTSKPTGHGVRIHIAGRLDEPKGIAALLSLLMPKLPTDWCVNLYGDGPLRSDIEQQHAGTALRLHGHRPYAEILHSTFTANVVIVPSVWEEAFGMVTLEALRLGKVCYALNRGGTPELSPYCADGQLRLYEDLPSLVAALLTETNFIDRLGGESANEQKHLQTLLTLYSQRIRPHQS